VKLERRYSRLAALALAIRSGEDDNGLPVWYSKISVKPSSASSIATINCACG
jgi:hypothetical protein